MTFRDRVAPFYRRLHRALPVAGRGFRILILHHVPPKQRHALEQLLDYVIREHGLLTPGEAEGALRGDDGVLPEKRIPWLITFDDGFASDLEVARSILQPRNVKAVMFVCPGLIDAGPSIQAQFVDQYVFPGGVARPSDGLPRMLTWEEVGALRNLGHTIGSHSLLHRRLNTLPAADLEHDLLASADRLRSKGIPSTWFAYPFGDLESISTGVLDMISRRFTFCCSGIRGINTSGTHRAAILREGVDVSASLEYAKTVADGGLDVFYLGRRKRLARMIAKIPRQAGGP